MIHVGWPTISPMRSSAGQSTQPGSMLAAVVEPAVLDDARQAAADGQVRRHVLTVEHLGDDAPDGRADRLGGRRLRRLLAHPLRPPARPWRGPTSAALTPVPPTSMPRASAGHPGRRARGWTGRRRRWRRRRQELVRWHGREHTPQATCDARPSCGRHAAAGIRAPGRSCSVGGPGGTRHASRACLSCASIVAALAPSWRRAGRAGASSSSCGPQRDGFLALTQVFAPYLSLALVRVPAAVPAARCRSGRSGAGARAGGVVFLVRFVPGAVACPDRADAGGAAVSVPSAWNLELGEPVRDMVVETHPRVPRRRGRARGADARPRGCASPPTRPSRCRFPYQVLEPRGGSLGSAC